jgi:hypothetical protein
LLTTNTSSYAYAVELPPTTLSCDRGWITGVAQANLIDTDASSSSNSSSDSSISSNSSLSSDSSTLKNLYHTYFGSCDGPGCSSEYYCYYDVVEEWVCSDEISSASSVSEPVSESSQSESSLSSLSSLSLSLSTNEPINCSPTVIIIFG